MPISNGDPWALSPEELGALNERLSVTPAAEVAKRTGQWAVPPTDEFVGPYNMNVSKPGNARGFLGQKGAQYTRAWETAARRQSAPYYGQNPAAPLPSKGQMVPQGAPRTPNQLIPYEGYPVRAPGTGFTMRGAPYGPTTPPVEPEAMRLLSAPKQTVMTAGQDMARRMGGYMGSQTSASKASRMADIMGAAAAAKDLFNSDALNAAGAMDAAAPVARASVPYARAALGAASRFAWPAYVAAAGYGLGKDAMDPNSALRQASAPAKADMRRDWAEGNYLSAVGDVVRATAATAPEVISQLLTPKPIFGGDNQRGLLQGLFGAERPEERNVRLAQEASPEGRYQAYLAAGGPANIDEFRQQRGSKATPAQGAQAQSAAVPRDMAIPFSVWDDYAKVYHAMAPKPKNYRDIAGENLLAMAAARAKQLPAMPDAQRQLEQEKIADLYGRVLNPQNAYGGNWLNNPE